MTLATIKKILKDNGVKVVSAKEQISSDSSGVITEGMLEIVADWFSKQLSEKVNRGLRLRAEQAKHNGGNMPFGYNTDNEGHYVLDNARAPIVKELFRRVCDGETSSDIIKDLEKRGIKTVHDRYISKNTMARILRNEMYIGVYTYDDIRIPAAVPRIIDDETFGEVQKILGVRKIYKGHRPAKQEYILTGKLYCGHCKELMSGTSGTSHTGDIHRYYTCKNSPKKCNKKNVHKEYIESKVLQTCREVLSDELIDALVNLSIELNKNDQESTEIIRLRKDIKATEKKAEGLLEKIERGVASDLITERLLQREKELASLRAQLQMEIKMQEIIDPDEIERFLKMLRAGQITNPKYKRIMIRTFIDRIYLYDDHFKIMFNHSGKQSKTSKREALEIEVALDTGIGSETCLVDAPNKIDPIHTVNRVLFSLKINACTLSIFSIPTITIIV